LRLNIAALDKEGFCSMGARKDLNVIHLFGALTLAGIFGLATDSWSVFAIAGALLIGFCC
jgi:hypothetical protein